jgi:hypothetical protein
MIRSREVFHLSVHRGQIFCWGKDGYCLEDLEFSSSIITGDDAEKLFHAANEVIPVRFGDPIGQLGGVLVLNGLWFWLTPRC